MGSVDDLLIEKIVSPVCGWARDQWGITQWRMSIESLNGSVAFYVAAVAVEIAGKGPADGIFLIMLRALLWLLILDAARKRAYRQAASSVGSRTARAGEWLFRMILGAMLPLSLLYADGWNNIFYSVSLMLLVCHLYFKASDLPPPQPRGRLARAGA